jgi:hypothetical protein
MWNEDELPQQWKESIIVPIYKKDNEIDCSNCQGMSRFQVLLIKVLILNSPESGGKK